MLIALGVWGRAPRVRAARRHTRLNFSNTHINLPLTRSIVPDSIHTKAWLRNLNTCYSVQEFLLPAIYLKPSLLVIRDCHPFIAPITWRDCVAVSTAGWSWVQQELLLDRPALSQSEGGDVPRQRELVCAR